MGLFDFFRRGKKQAGEDGPQVDRKFANLAKVATDKRAQAYDREEALRALCAVGTPQAAQVLLKRFTFRVDPSITDQEEKALCFDGIVRVGTGAAGVRPDGSPSKNDQGEPVALAPEEVTELREAVVEAVRTFCVRAESLNWPLRVFRELLDDDEYQDELLVLLSEHDTEYIRNVEPKIDLLAALEEIVSPQVREAVEPYLDDVNETVRFHAVETTFKQGDDACLPALVKLVETEESVRIKNKVAAGISGLNWTIPAALRESFAKGLADTDEYRMTSAGKVKKA